LGAVEDPLVGVGLALSLGVEAVGDGMAASGLDLRRWPERAACDRPLAAPDDTSALDLSAEGASGATRSSGLLAVALGWPGTAVSGLTGPPVRLTTKTIGYPAHKAPTP
jgi:hypothetical protein